MKARIAFLEGEKRGVDNMRLDLMKRVKMLEYALRQERSKYVEGKGVSPPQAAAAVAVAAAAASPITNAGDPVGNNINKMQNRMSTYSISGQSMAQVSPTSAAGNDPAGRAKSREFLRVCLQEISYLTASVPPSIASAMPAAPAMPHRLTRHESERRFAGVNGMRGAGWKNRHSDFFPASMPPAALARSNSVPISTLHPSSRADKTAKTRTNDLETTIENGSVDGDNPDQATLRQMIPKPTQTPVAEPTADLSDNQAKESSDQNSIPHEEKKENLQEAQVGTSSTGPEDKLNPFQNSDAVTAVHVPTSAEQWRGQLQKAGESIEIKSKANMQRVAEDETQLSKDVQDKFNITPERIIKIVKDWDKSKVEPAQGKNAASSKPSKDAAVDELTALDITESSTIDSESGVNGGDSTEPEPIRWPLLSGSEDGTIKYWNLETPLYEAGKRPLVGEVEPIHTYRGHTKAITSVAISADQNKCFSASMDSTIRSWQLVSMEKDTYARADQSLPLSSFIGHTDTIWDIRLFPLSISSSQLLVSISADGALKIWDTETKGSPLRSSWGYHGLEPSALSEPTEAYTSGLGSLPVPTSMDFCPTDLKKMVVSYSNSIMKLFDIETGKAIISFKSDESYNGTSTTQINKVVCHPTMPMAISGHEDRYIRFFDINTGQCSYSMLAHLDSVSSLDIDPSGLALCSGGHDASVRLWDIAAASRPCLQEFTGHRKKSDEGVCTVKYHPTVPDLLATGGADSIVKVYTRS
ncbi:hypothetical protein BGW38_000789 [Lunasporangiospora selenospora]|uniref:Striatin N-terminal domain-containing protein n=1 Tax=Lunasporangiospora selenospora TaxID=979761 RepID=A0A9P6KI27_9FUNG|nr:hypothetical protein BGW38_000789 [Lunasporangiospora selenospora]